MAFTAFNIRLDNGCETKAGTPLFNDGPLWSSVRRCLNVLFPQGVTGLRIADLACLEGGYAVEFARMGFGEILGIEVREENFANCLTVKNGLSLSNLQFVRDDVWNIEGYGQFDVIFCGGILYHLDKPKRFLELLSRCVRKAVLINTHFSTTEPIAKYALSDLDENEGLLGRWFAEPSDPHPWASWGNARSFWILREHLIQAIRDAGFPMVFEEYDLLGGDIATALISGCYKTENRNLFVGVKV